MRTIRLNGVDKPVSVIGLGTMIFAPDKKELSFSILDAFVHNGGTLIDTAEIYGVPENYGYSEQTIGMWLKERNCREQVVLMSKGCIPDTCVPLYGEGLRVSPEYIHRAIAGSLHRLNTEYLDVWLLHRDDPGVPVGELMEALNEEVRAGTIRAFGGSNWSTERLQQANEYAAAHALQKMSASSPLFSLAEAQRPFFPGTTYLNEADIHWHENTGLPVLAWSSLGRGFFKYGKPGYTTNENVMQTFYCDRNFARVRRAEQLAEQKGVSKIEIALAYVTSQSFAGAALVGPGSPEHVKACMQAGKLLLSKEECRFLENGK